MEKENSLGHVRDTQILYKSYQQLIFSNRKFVVFLERKLLKGTVYWFDGYNGIRRSFADLKMDINVFNLKFEKCNAETVNIFFNYARDHIENIHNTEIELERLFNKKHRPKKLVASKIDLGFQN